MNRRTSPLTVVSLIVLVLLINAPVLHSFYVDRRVESAGVERQVPVVRVTEEDGRSFVQFNLGTDEEPDVWAAEVDPEQSGPLAEGDTIAARVVPGHPAQHRVAGEVRNWVPLVVTLVVDLFLLLGFVLHRRFRRARFRPVELDALEDVTRTRAPAALEHVEADVWIVRGEVEQIGEDLVVIDTGRKSVTVHLGGHRNPARHQQPVEVRARLRP